MGERGKRRMRIHTDCEDEESIKVEKFERFRENYAATTKT